MGGYEHGGLWKSYKKSQKVDFSIEKLTFFAEKYFFQNLILGIWESPGESLKLSGRPRRLK